MALTLTRPVEVQLLRPASGPFAGLVRIGPDTYQFTPTADGFAFLKVGPNAAVRSVRVLDGRPAGCTCPDKKYRPGRRPGCKHECAAARLLAMGG